jgi:uncharacterized RDD family membrane protein YckC
MRALSRDVPEPMERLVDRMMAKEPSRRFDSYDELLAALRAARPGARRHIGFWKRGAALGLDALVIGALALAVGWFAAPVAAAYFLVAHARWGATLGKRALKLRVTDARGAPLGWRAAAIRLAVFAWGPLAWGALGAFVYLLHRDQRVSFTLGRLTLRELWLPFAYASIAAAIFVAYLGGFILAAFHPERRALHDLVARTEVTQR